MKIVPRSQWRALPPKSTPTRMGPVSTVIIHHDAGSFLETVEQEKARMRADQNYHQATGYNDIAYAFGNGKHKLYEGRGYGVMCGATEGWNERSIPIMFMGNYENGPPTKAQLKRAGKCIRRGVKNGSITKAYDVIGHRDTKPTACPGSRLYSELDRIDHYSRPAPVRFLVTATRVVAGRKAAKRVAARLRDRGYKVKKDRKP